MKVKLESFLQELSEKTTKNDQYPVLTSSKAGLYLQSDYFNKQVASKDNTGYKIIRRGQFTYRAMSDTGEFFPNMLECTDIGIVSPAYPVFEITQPEIIIPEFLKYFFKSDSFQYSIASFAQGSTRTSVKFGKMKTISINLPRIAEQRHIVEVLDRAKAVVASREQELQKLDDLIKAQFVEMFGDPNEERTCWKEVSIGDHCFVTKLAGFEYTNYIHYEDSGDVVMVKAQNVKNGSLNEKELSYISKEVSDSLPRSQLAPGDVVMTYVGANIGDVAIIDNRHKYHLAPNVAKIRPDIKEYNSVFFMYMLMMKTDYIMRNSADTAKAALGMERIRKLKVFSPPLELQNEFATFVKQIDKSKFAVQKALDKAQLLFDSLMQQYFG